MRTSRAQKAALTRAKNSGDPRKVIAEVDRTFAEWDEFGFSQVEHGNYPKPGMWPDTWHTWNIAKEDAVMALQRNPDYDAQQEIGRQV